MPGHLCLARLSYRAQGATHVLFKPIAQHQTSSYICCMNSLIKTSLVIGLSSFLLVSYNTSAQLYKGVDADGNVVYSDKPFEDAESFTPPGLSIMDAPRVEKEETAAEEPEEDKPETTYSRFSISSPS